MSNANQPDWNGLPLSPEESGAHEFSHAPGDPNEGPWIMLWCAPERLWTDIFGNRAKPDQVLHLRYVGPCMRPAERKRMGTALNTCFRLGNEAGKRADAAEAALVIADAACRSYHDWEWGPPDENEGPDADLLVRWKEDYDRRQSSAAVPAAAGK